MTPSPWNPRNGKCHVVKMVLGTPAKAPRTRSDRHHLATFSKANQTRNQNGIYDVGAHGMNSNLSELQEISLFQTSLMNYSRLILGSLGYHGIGMQLRGGSSLSTFQTRNPWSSQSITNLSDLNMRSPLI